MIYSPGYTREILIIYSIKHIIVAGVLAIIATLFHLMGGYIFASFLMGLASFFLIWLIYIYLRAFEWQKVSKKTFAELYAIGYVLIAITTIFMTTAIIELTLIEILSRNLSKVLITYTILGLVMLYPAGVFLFMLYRSSLEAQDYRDALNSIYENLKQTLNSFRENTSNDCLTKYQQKLLSLIEALVRTQFYFIVKSRKKETMYEFLVEKIIISGTLTFIFALISYSTQYLISNLLY